MNSRGKVHMKIVSLENILNFPMIAALFQTKTNKKETLTIVQVQYVD